VARSLGAVARPNVPITSVSTQTTLSTSVTDIAESRAAVAGAQRDYESAVADIRKAEADNVKAQADLMRYKQLVAKDEISKQQYDEAEAAAKSAAANVDAKRATAEASGRKIEEAQARLEQSQTKQVEAERNRPQQIAIQNATVENRQASAQHQQTLVDQAVLNLSYTKIFAPVDGIIGKKNAEPGQQVAPGQQLMADVPVSNIWVTANFKETQLKRMRANQRATIHVDSYDRDYEGYVESLAGATGARFSLLPPENATGNYVKVVQRVPVRIRIKEGQDPNHELRPGMSVDPKVWLDSK
jgi:membrane fusion protein (multidrug efflux system)